MGDWRPKIRIEKNRSRIIFEGIMMKHFQN